MRYSVLVNSCDKYEKIWPVFFSMLGRFWPENKETVFLNTETKSYMHEEVRIESIHTGAHRTWSARLIAALQQITTPYVLMILDDFILEEKVDHAKFLHCLQYFHDHAEIGMFQFTVGADAHRKDIENTQWGEMSPRTPYRINCQIALWRKEYLLKLLRTFESPWEFEKYGSLRSRRMKQKVYAWGSERGYVFTYNWGKPIIGGRWNLDEVDRLEEKLGIHFDVSGRETVRNYYETRGNDRPKRNGTWLIKKLKHVRSWF